MSLIRWLFAYLAWSIETIGYWIRPYDMLADRRRWRWQPRQRCGWSYGLRANRSDECDENMPANMPGAALGWDEHGHARKTGLSLDRYLGSGDLQDAEDCGYAPLSVLAELGIDTQHGDILSQYRNGRIVLLNGAVLELGGNLNAVWAITQLPAHEGKCPVCWSLTAEAQLRARIDQLRNGG